MQVSGNERLDRFPDFLIVGPQRTGTTWLHAHLRYHPEIMCSEPKELYYFSSLKVSDKPRFPSRRLEDYLRYFREPLWRVLFRQGMSLWRYRKLYRPKVRGEATASYAVIDEDVIAEIAAVKPDIKVVLMIRNPIDRAWSHAKKDLVRNRGRKFADVAPEEFERFFAHPYQVQCARYTENIDRWAAHLKPGHLLVALFDDVDTRPEELLLEVMTFLGVISDRRYIAAEVSEPVNPTGSNKIPERYRSLLANMFAGDLDRLKDRWGLSWGDEGKGLRIEAPARRTIGTTPSPVFALHHDLESGR